MRWDTRTIEQGENEEVKQIRFDLIRISKENKFKAILNSSNGEKLPATLRSVEYLKQKKENGINLFNLRDFNRFVDSEDGNITPLHSFTIYPIININAREPFCYSITFEELIPSTPEFIEANVYNSPYSRPSRIEFGLGIYKVKTKNNLPIRINLGNFSGDSGINFEGININRTFNHTKRQIQNLIKILGDIVELDSQNNFKTVDELMIALKPRL